MGQERQRHTGRVRIAPVRIFRARAGRRPRPRSAECAFSGFGERGIFHARKRRSRTAALAPSRLSDVPARFFARHRVRPRFSPRFSSLLFVRAAPAKPRTVSEIARGRFEFCVASGAGTRPVHPRLWAAKTRTLSAVPLRRPGSPRALSAVRPSGFLAPEPDFRAIVLAWRPNATPSARVPASLNLLYTFKAALPGRRRARDLPP